MKLYDYLKTNGITQSEFAKMLMPPVSQGKVNHWLHGTRRVSLVEALQIQRITAGQVSVFDLATPPANQAQAATEAVAGGM